MNGENRRGEGAKGASKNKPAEWSNKLPLHSQRKEQGRAAGGQLVHQRWPMIQSRGTEATIERRPDISP